MPPLVSGDRRRRREESQQLPREPVPGGSATPDLGDGGGGPICEVCSVSAQPPTSTLAARNHHSNRLCVRYTVRFGVPAANQGPEILGLVGGAGTRLCHLDGDRPGPAETRPESQGRRDQGGPVQEARDAG